MGVQRTLDHFNIIYSEQGENIGRGCIGTNCPYCPEGDNLKHCGIFLSSGRFTCWRCKAGGSLYKLINKIKHIPYDEYANFVGIKHREETPKSELDKIFKGRNKMKQEKEEKFSLYDLKKEMEKFMIPAYVLDISTSYYWLIERFMNERNFTQKLLEKHGVLYAHSGTYQGRLVIPIPVPYIGELVGVIARDITGTAKKKYIFPFGFKAHNYIYSMSKYTYSIKKFVIVEGVLDAWAVSPYSSSIAIFGKELSDSQLFKIINTICFPRESEMIIMLDGDATMKDSQKIVDKLSSFFKKVRVVNLPENEDPASIDRNEVQKVLES